MAEEARPRLGRGLAALIGDAGDEAPAIERTRGQRRIPIEFLRPNPRNPRTSFREEDLADLAASIREKGIIQPVVVRTIAGVADAYEIIAGEGVGAPPNSRVSPIFPWSFMRPTIARLSSWRSSRTSSARISTRSRKRVAMSGWGRFWLFPIGAGENHRQEPLACRQYAAAAESARGDAGDLSRTAPFPPATPARCCR